MCLMVFVMIVLGGATRLTGSGLSIMEWAPLSGALPPWSDAEWKRLFALYQRIPQYELINKDFGIDGFKRIFWLEWSHRLWGRLIGLVFVVPLLVLAWRGAIERRLLPRLALLFVLGGLQGAVGWFMVASGFLPDSTSVSPTRLVVHLVLALVLYAALLWTGMSVWRPASPGSAPVGLRRLIGGTGVLAALTIVAGGFVAGTHAGLAYNSFPLMDGWIVPDGYAMLRPFWRNLAENIAAVQFNHRALATMTAGLALVTTVHGLRTIPAGPARPWLLALAGAVVLQYWLGIATLIAVVPIGLATAHQAGAVLLLTALIAVQHAMRPSYPLSPTEELK